LCGDVWIVPNVPMRGASNLYRRSRSLHVLHRIVFTARGTMVGVVVRTPLHGLIKGRALVPFTMILTTVTSVGDVVAIVTLPLSGEDGAHRRIPQERQGRRRHAPDKE
jgi:hypothetical protein